MSLNLFANKKDLESAQSKIESLESDVSELQSSLATAQSVASAHAETIASMQDQLTAISAERDALKADLEFANLEVNNLKAAVESAEKSAETKAVALIAQSGAEAPLKIENEQSAVKEKTREEFNKLSAKEKSDFCINGGRII